MVLIRRSFTELGEGDPVQLGRFRLLALLSSGGYGDVFLGQNEQGDLAAIKVPRQRGEPDPRALQSFRREVGLYMGVSSRFTPDFTAADLTADQEAGELRLVVLAAVAHVQEGSPRLRLMAAGAGVEPEGVSGVGVVHALGGPQALHGCGRSEHLRGHHMGLRGWTPALRGWTPA